MYFNIILLTYAFVRKLTPEMWYLKGEKNTCSSNETGQH